MINLETYLRSYLADPLTVPVYSPVILTGAVGNSNPLLDYLRKYLADPLNIS